MIISEYVNISARSRCKYWSDIMGYKINYKDIIKIPISNLPLESNKMVECQCDNCHTKFNRPYQLVSNQVFHRCYYCSKINNGKLSGIKQSGISRNYMLGEKHPRWNPNKSEMEKYARDVHRLTKKNKHIWSLWENADKIGLCGKEGVYQLDHKISIKYGFLNMIPPSILANIENLQIITWEENRKKAHSNSIDLWDLLELVGSSSTS